MGHMEHTVRVYLGDFKLGLDTGPYSLLNKINQIFSRYNIGYSAQRYVDA